MRLTPRADGRLTLALEAQEARGGLWRALALLGAWGVLLASTLSWPFEGQQWAWALVLVPLQTFLYTGIFITAHDAMHGIVYPPKQRVNDALGALAVLVYALFSYEAMRREHHGHHRHAGTQGDPDWHGGLRPGFMAWYVRFLRHYMTWRQLVGMALVFNALAHLGEIPQLRLVVFWVLPSILSTFQLFYFGTYLPHRGDGFDDEHRARSNAYPEWLSMLTCYHFGYHWEHHAYPHCPWWRLPALRRALRAP